MEAPRTSLNVHLPWPQAADLLPQPPPLTWIQRGRGLVEQEHPRLAQ